MTSAPTTLAEYHSFVREEALRIQKDMNWPDDKLNEALRNLGLPEKLVFRVPITVTAEMTMLVRVDDATSEQEARDKIAAWTGDQVRDYVRDNVNANQFTYQPPAVTDMPPLEVGAPDLTMSGVAYAAFARSPMCETYRSGGAHYCTRERGHEGQHARGDGRLLTHVWDA